MQEKKKKILVTGIFIIIFTICISTLAYFKIFNPWQLQFADYLYGIREPSKDIVIVTVDDASLNDNLGLGNFEQWSRLNFAKVLNTINNFEPKVIAFDFLFTRKKDDDGDIRFQEALKNTIKPIIIYPGNPSSYDHKDGYFIQKKNTITNGSPLEIYSQIKNIVLSSANLLFDNDNVARRIMPFIYDEETNLYRENLSFSIARRILGDQKGPIVPDISHSTYKINLGNGKKLEIPLENGQMLINYVSIPQVKEYTTISFIDIYKGNLKNMKELFKDKIIFIIPAALYFKDRSFTPVDKTYSMQRGEIQANALQTILDQNFLRNITFPEQLIFLFLLCLGSAFAFMFTKIRWSVLFLVIVPSIYTLIVPFAFQHGLILDLVHPYLALASIFVATYMYRYLTEFKEKNALRMAFSKYVNPEVIEQIMAHPEKLKLGGEKRDLSVLFTDVAHFTSISEKLKPESLVALLNEYFQAMSEVIFEQGGTLDKFEGDAIMAFFGAPISQPDHAIHACTTALKMRQKLTWLLEKWDHDEPLPGGEKKPRIDFRCGISSGEVIVGNMGSSEHFDYTVMGDIVNLGSRLEGANKKYETHIMVSEMTAKAVEGHFELRELDIIRVVGKSEAIKIFELLNVKGELVPTAKQLLELYNEGMNLYHSRKFAEALQQFNKVLEMYPEDGPSKLYRQRCEVLKDYPPKESWDGVYEMGSK